MRIGEAEARLLLERCRDVLAGGGLVILPTDTVYGLAAAADIREAVERIYDLKGREKEKALVVMVSGLEEAAALAAPEQRADIRRLGALWPGPLTLVVKAGDMSWRENVAAEGYNLGIRVPDHPFLLPLLESTGPLAVTSANRAGEEAPASLADIGAYLLEEVELAVEGVERGSGRPSTVADISGGGLRILREGYVSEEELERAMEPPGAIRGGCE